MTDAIPEKTHAVLSPSGAHRWARCPGSAALERGQPNRSSPYARWGTVAHEVAGLILGELAERADLQAWEPRCAEAWVGRVFTADGHEIEFDREMADCVNDYVAHVEPFWSPGDIILAEQATPLEHVTGELGATGTSDCIIIKPAAREIVVIDLKTGKGVAVDAEENEQGLLYAAGAVEAHDIFHGPFETVRIVISQPRLHSISEWAIDAEEFENRIFDLRVAAREAAHFLRGLDGDPPLVPGEKQCKFCNAKAICPALAGDVTRSLHLTAGPAGIEEFADLTLPKQASAAASFAAEAGSVDNDKLAEAMRAAPLVEQWLSAVRGEVERRLFDGQTVPGFYLGVGKRGSRAWTSEADAEAAMKTAKIKADEMYTRKVISPTAAEKLLKERPRVWAKLAALIGQAPGKPSVCKDGDKNEPYRPVPAAEEFPELDGAEDMFS